MLEIQKSYVDRNYYTAQTNNLLFRSWWGRHVGLVGTIDWL